MGATGSRGFIGRYSQPAAVRSRAPVGRRTKGALSIRARYRHGRGLLRCQLPHAADEITCYLSAKSAGLCGALLFPRELEDHLAEVHGAEPSDELAERAFAPIKKAPIDEERLMEPDDDEDDEDDIDEPMPLEREAAEIIGRSAARALAAAVSAPRAAGELEDHLLAEINGDPEAP